MICTTSLSESLYSIGRFPSHLWMRYMASNVSRDKESQLCISSLCGLCMERTVRMASLNLLLTGRSTGAGPEEAIIVPSRGVRGATPAALWVPYERPRAIGTRLGGRGSRSVGTGCHLTPLPLLLHAITPGFRIQMRIL